MGLIDYFLNFFFVVVVVEVMFLVCLIDFNVKYLGEILKCVVVYCGILFVEVY